MTWTDVCAATDLVADRGAAAVVDGQVVAVFLLGCGAVHAVDARDPRTGAIVLARGLVGEHGGRRTVASPLHKQRYDRATGECLDGGEPIATWPARVRDGRVEVAVAVDAAATTAA
jgi:nitrite reductase (NADH) small subunit